MKTSSIYLFLAILLQACTGPTRQATDENIPLFAEPVSFALDTTRGYKINQLTGDSIKPLRNAAGHIIPTGISVPFIGRAPNEEKTFTSSIISPVISRKPSSVSIQPVPEGVRKIPVDTNLLKQVKLGEGDSTFILRNSMDIIPTGVRLKVNGKKMPVIAASPIRMLPFRSKDEATAGIQYLDVEQGLPNSYITKLLRDSKGNIWFGTDGLGIGKYDGIRVTHYPLKETIAGTPVTALTEDRKGNIWIGSFNGLTIFDGAGIIHITESEGLSNNNIRSILEDKNGNIWVGTDYCGVSKFEPADLSNGVGNITHYTTKEGLPHNAAGSLMQDSKGNIWIGSNLGVACFDGKKFRWLKTNDGPGLNIIRTLLEDRKGNIWIGSEDNLSCYDGKTLARYTQKEGLLSNTVIASMEDEKGNIWVGTMDGLCKFDGKSFTHFTEELGLTKNRIVSLTDDGQGNIWCAAEGGGINKLNDAGFSYLISNELFDLSRVRPIMKDHTGHLWFGTEAGNLYKFDGLIQEKYDLGGSAKYYGMRAMHTGKNGNRWFGTTDGGGLLLLKNNTFYRYKENNETRSLNIMAIEEDNEGNIWLGCHGDGAIKITRQGSPDNRNAVSSYTMASGLTANRVMVIRCDKKGALWMGTEGGGLCKVDGDNITSYTEREGLFAKTVNAITEDGEGNLWLGTMGAGVVRFDGKNFTYYSEQQGLCNNNVWSLYRDAAKRIWVGTDKGLALFNPQKSSASDSSKKYVLYNFGSSDGLKAIDFNLHSVCVDNNNRIWWGTGKAVPTLDLNHSFEPFVPRSLTLSHIEINEKFYDFRNLPDSAEKQISFASIPPFTNYPASLELSHDQNHLSFHFAAIDWSAPDKIKYSYRLSGLDDHWSTPANTARADYRGLGHGQYEFQVKAIGQSQQWTSPLTYSFSILPAWWQTWWFKAILVLGAMALSLFISRLIYLSRLRRQRTEMEKKLAVQMERQRISAEMHDDIGAGLSGVRLLTEITKSKVKGEQAAEDVGKIYQSLGDISSKMKEVIWSLNAEHDHLPNLVSYIQKQARNWLEHYPCQLTIDADDKIPDIPVFGEARRNIFLVVKEAFHNIIKHSEASKVQLSFHWRLNQLIIVVADNGKGVVSGKADEAGNGMRNMRHRIGQLHGKFTIKNEDGLILTFEIPIQTAAI